MKFAQTLNTHLTPEWRTQYMNYEQLKSMLLMAMENVPADVGDMRSRMDYYASIDEDFYYHLEREITKVNTFFAEKLAEARRKYAVLEEEIDLYTNRSVSNMYAASNRLNLARTRSKLNLRESFLRTRLSKRRMKQLKFAFSELYLGLVLLQNYQNLNYTGFRKILKKHDKLFRSNTGAKWFHDYVDNAAFYNNSEILNLIHGVEDIYAQHLEKGDRKKAMKRLRVPPFVDVHQPWTTFRVGLFSGAMLVMLIILFCKFLYQDLSTANMETSIRLFRASLLMTLHYFLYGLNVHGWRIFGVNHILIFEIDPRHHLSSTNVMEMACGLGVLWTLFMLGFMYNAELNIPPYVFPLVLYILMLAFLLNPLPIMNYYSRFWFVRLILRVISAPFCKVGFADFWFADQLNSLTTCVADFYYIICFYCTNYSWSVALDPAGCMEESFILEPIVQCLPAWFRFAQCLRRYRDTKLVFPFLVNAGKYATTYPYVIFATLIRYHKEAYNYTFENPYVWGYLISRTISTVYCLAWDYLKDFGVFKKWSGENIFLRDQIVYPPSFYYFAIIEDFVIRFQWVLAFYLIETSAVNPLHVGTITGTLEVIRRYIWNYFRLEHEHLYNCGMFRAVRDISVAPIDPKDQLKLQRMMDLVGGVKNRRKRESKDEDDKDD